MVLIAPSILLASALAQSKVCDVRCYGAKGDGTTKDTKAIQAAIDDCSNGGGGTVRLSGGQFVTAPIELKSNVELDLREGCRVARIR